MAPHTKRRRITAARRERMADALRLREHGKTYREISAILDVSVKVAYEDVQDALAEITREPAEAVLQIELTRLDEVYERMRDVMVQTSDTKAAEVVLKTLDRRAKYLGLDKQDTTANATGRALTGIEKLLEISPDPDPGAFHVKQENQT